MAEPATLDEHPTTFLYSITSLMELTDAEAIRRAQEDNPGFTNYRVFARSKERPRDPFLTVVQFDTNDPEQLPPDLEHHRFPTYEHFDALMEAEEMVREFHRTFGLGIGDSNNIALNNAELRLDLIGEEYGELAKAVEDNDIVEAADALADLLVVVLGSAVEWGMWISPIFAEVHRTNMAKVGGHRREDGKWIKPEGWQPPNIEQCLMAQVEE